MPNYTNQCPKCRTTIRKHSVQYAQSIEGWCPCGERIALYLDLTQTIGNA